MCKMCNKKEDEIVLTDEMYEWVIEKLVLDDETNNQKKDEKLDNEQENKR